MKTILTAAVFLLLSVVGYSQPDASAKSKVFVFRSSGSAISLATGISSVNDLRKFKVFVDGSFVCKVGNNTSLELAITPGQHAVAIQLNGKKLKKNAKETRILVEPGKEYYLLTVVRENADGRKLYLDEIPLATGLTTIPGLKATACAD